jgi:hypothetical protein
MDSHQQIRRIKVPKYKITKIMRYTETLEVEAEDVPTAITKSYEMDGEHNNDDSLQDVRVVKISD